MDIKNQKLGDVIRNFLTETMQQEEENFTNIFVKVKSLLLSWLSDNLRISINKELSSVGVSGRTFSFTVGWIDNKNHFSLEKILSNDITPFQWKTLYKSTVDLLKEEGFTVLESDIFQNYFSIRVSY